MHNIKILCNHFKELFSLVHEINNRPKPSVGRKLGRDRQASISSWGGFSGSLSEYPLNMKTYAWRQDHEHVTRPCADGKGSENNLSSMTTVPRRGIQKGEKLRRDRLTGTSRTPGMVPVYPPHSILPTLAEQQLFLGQAHGCQWQMNKD